MKANGHAVASTPTLRVLIATPIQNGQVWGDTAECLLRIALEDGAVPGLQFRWERMGGLGLPEARNELAYLALRDGYHATLAWDSDIIAKPHDPLGLARHGKHLIGGLYRHKTNERLTWCANFLPGEQPDKNGALRVEDCGAGFLWFSTKLLADMIAKGVAKPYTRGFWGKPKGTTMYDFFSPGVVDDPLHDNEPTYKTEDFIFAHRARLAGYDAFVDTTLRVDHLGVTKFSGTRADMPEPWKVEPIAPAQS